MMCPPMQKPPGPDVSGPGGSLQRPAQTCLLRTIKAEVASTSELHSALPPERLPAYEAEYDALNAAGLAANPPSAKTSPRPIGRRNQMPP